MEETTPKPVAPGIDVVTPHAAATHAPATAAAEPAAVQPVPASATEDDPKDKPAPKPEAAAKPAKPAKPPKPDKVPGSGVGGAIFATVIIVLALAAMATYAYIKTQK